MKTFAIGVIKTTVICFIILQYVACQVMHFCFDRKTGHFLCNHNHNSHSVKKCSVSSSATLSVVTRCDIIHNTEQSPVTYRFKKKKIFLHNN